MATKLIFVCCVLICLKSFVPAEPSGRIPRLYNALITSNENLEPSKSVPLYQAVLQHFPYQSVVYGDFLSVPPLTPQAEIQINTEMEEVVATMSPSSEPIPTLTVPEPQSAAPSTAASEKDGAPQPPVTESPIPLNQFGLPARIIPLSQLSPDYGQPRFDRFPFPYPYPGFGMYGPYAPFGLNPLHYPAYPMYGPINNFANQYIPKQNLVPPSTAPAAGDKSTVASASSDNVGNYQPPKEQKNPVGNYQPKEQPIPNVPAPSLPLTLLKAEYHK